MIIIGYDINNVTQAGIHELQRRIEMGTGISVVAAGISHGPDLQFWDTERLSEGALRQVGTLLNLKHVPPGYEVVPSALVYPVLTFPGLCWVLGRFLGERYGRVQQHLCSLFQRILGLSPAGDGSGAVQGAGAGKAAVRQGKGVN